MFIAFVVKLSEADVIVTPIYCYLILRLGWLSSLVPSTVIDFPANRCVLSGTSQSLILIKWEYLASIEVTVDPKRYVLLVAPKNELV